ncbi:MAG: hypothetical protein ACLFSB_09440 [Chitinispirillaceae bacterium]
MKRSVHSLLMIGLLSLSVFAAEGYQMSISEDGTKLLYGGNEAFLSGMNIAWFKFSQDVGRQGEDGGLLYVDESLVRKTFQDLRKAGANTARWWLYTNNAMDPIFDATTNMTTGIETSTIGNVQTVLDIAEEYGIVVSICFLSFDMLKKDHYSPDVEDGWSRYNYDANHLMLTDTSATRAFIDHAVLPLVERYKDHPGLLCWEMFNEPEGMTSTDNFGSGWGTELIDISYIQRFINMVSDAIHTEAPHNLVSNGSAKTTMNSDVAGTNYYTDEQLLAAGYNKYPQGTLDFYQVHYYPQWNANEHSPFHNPASHWELTKPLVIGEFPAGDWDHEGVNANAHNGDDRRMTVDSAYSYAFNQGYAGALSWMFFGDSLEFYQTKWCLDSVAGALTSLYENYPDQIKFKDVTFEDNTDENGWMQVTYDNAAKDARLSYTKALNLTGATTVSMDVINTATTSINYMFVFQTGASDDWGWYQSSTFCEVDAGDTVTGTFNLEDIAKHDDASALITDHLNQINAVFLVSTAAFDGTVYIDNVVTDNGIVIHDFNEQYDVFSPAGDESANISTTTYYADELSVAQPATAKRVQGGRMNLVNGALRMIVPAAGAMSVNLYNVKGERVATLHNGMLEAGTHVFKLKNLAKGLYVVRAHGAAGLFTGQVILK